MEDKKAKALKEAANDIRKAFSEDGRHLPYGTTDEEAMIAMLYLTPTPEEGLDILFEYLGENALEDYPGVSDAFDKYLEDMESRKGSLAEETENLLLKDAQYVHPETGEALELGRIFSGDTTFNADRTQILKQDGSWVKDKIKEGVIDSNDEEGVNMLLTLWMTTTPYAMKTEQMSAARELYEKQTEKMSAQEKKQFEAKQTSKSRWEGIISKDKAKAAKEQQEYQKKRKDYYDNLPKEAKEGLWSYLPTTYEVAEKDGPWYDYIFSLGKDVARIPGAAYSAWGDPSIPYREELVMPKDLRKMGTAVVGEIFNPVEAILGRVFTGGAKLLTKLPIVRTKGFALLDKLAEKKGFGSLGGSGAALTKELKRGVTGLPTKGIPTRALFDMGNVVKKTGAITPYVLASTISDEALEEYRTGANPAEFTSRILAGVIAGAAMAQLQNVGRATMLKVGKRNREINAVDMGLYPEYGTRRKLRREGVTTSEEVEEVLSRAPRIKGVEKEDVMAGELSESLRNYMTEALAAIKSKYPDELSHTIDVSSFKNMLDRQFKSILEDPKIPEDVKKNLTPMLSKWKNVADSWGVRGYDVVPVEEVVSKAKVVDTSIPSVIPKTKDVDVQGTTFKKVPAIHGYEASLEDVRNLGRRFKDAMEKNPAGLKGENISQTLTRGSEETALLSKITKWIKEETSRPGSPLARQLPAKTLDKIKTADALFANFKQFAERMGIEPGSIKEMKKALSKSQALYDDFVNKTGKSIIRPKSTDQLKPQLAMVMELENVVDRVWSSIKDALPLRTHEAKVLLAKHAKDPTDPLVTKQIQRQFGDVLSLEKYLKWAKQATEEGGFSSDDFLLKAIHKTAGMTEDASKQTAKKSQQVRGFKGDASKASERGMGGEDIPTSMSGLALGLIPLSARSNIGKVITPPGYATVQGIGQAVRESTVAPDQPETPYKGLTMRGIEMYPGQHMTAQAKIDAEYEGLIPLMTDAKTANKFLDEYLRESATKGLDGNPELIKRFKDAALFPPYEGAITQEEEINRKYPPVQGTDIPIGPKGLVGR